jgi:O-antigen/teichoic acid export membrane protein
LKLIISRYFLYSFIALEVLFLPKFLSQELYAQIEYQKFILYFVPFFLFGAPSGYVYFKYNENKDYFSSLIVFGSIFGIIISLFLSLIYNNILFGIAGLFMTLFLIIEQKVKTEKQFFLALSIKPFISIVLLIMSYLVYINYIDKVNLKILYYSIFTAFIIWCFFIFIKIKEKFIFISKANFFEYKELLKKGFLINVATLLLMIFFFIDRYFTKEYYIDYLASYSFSYNLIQFVILALTTVAYVNVVNIGENIKKIKYSDIKQKIKKAYLVFFILFMLFIGFLLILNNFYNFKGFILISIILCFFIGIFYAMNSVASLAQYLDFQKEISLVMFIIVILNYISSYFMSIYEVEYIYLLIKSGVLLNIYTLFLYVKVKKEVLQMDNTNV